ncbi:MAG: MBL fold metallo-hydrolase [Candidatus Omnitrophota bacterium]
MKEKKCSFQLFLSIWIVIFMFGASVVGAVENPLSLSTVQEGVYRIVGLNLEVNVTCLVTGEGVLVIDSGTNPVEGRWIVERIKEKTDKPIKYVVLTHYHFDHSAGLMGFPKDVTVLAHANCYQNISKYNEARRVSLVEKVLPGQIQGIRQELETLKKQNSPDIKENETKLENLTRQLEAFQKANVVLPSVTFEQQLVLRLGGEKIECIYPGPTHTNGSICVYVPDKKLLVTGDMVFNGFIPYIDWKAGSNTRNWIDQLGKLSQWNIETVIPGHGEPVGKAVLDEQKRFLSDLRASVTEAIGKGLTLDQMKTSIKLANYSHLKFPNFLGSDIESVYVELTNSKKE